MLGVDLPAVLALVGDLVNAVAGLNSECDCKPLKVKRKVEACPHYRAAHALRRAGVEPADMARLRRGMDRKVGE